MGEEVGANCLSKFKVPGRLYFPNFKGRQKQSLGYTFFSLQFNVLSLSKFKFPGRLYFPNFKGRQKQSLGYTFFSLQFNVLNILN